LYTVKYTHMFFDSHRRMQKRNRRHIIIGAILASFFTTLIALLFAPKSGKELRKDIAEGVREASDTAVKMKAKAHKKLQAKAKKFAKKADQIKAAVEEKINHVDEVRLEKIDNESEKMS